MKLKNLTSLILILILLCTITGCQDSKFSDDDQRKAVISTYLENIKNGNADVAAQNVLFTDAEIEAGLPAVFCDAMKDYDYENYTINSITSLNESIYVADVVVKTNYDSKDKSEYSDVDFRPFIVYYEDKYMLALTREQVPKSLYGELEELPYNYDGSPNYITVDEGDSLIN